MGDQLNIKRFDTFLNEEANETSTKMKELIVQALDDAIIMLDKRTPQTKIEVKYIDIDGVKPLDIANYMKDNNIPDNAYFGLKSNSYDGFHGDIYLCYDVNIPTTDKDKMKFKKDKFSDIAFKPVYDLLTKNGYKRVGINTFLLKQFKDTTVYDMYISKDFDRLVTYYSMYFKLI
jgi:hypothetical protein